MKTAVAVIFMMASLSCSEEPTYKSIPIPPDKPEYQAARAKAKEISGHRWSLVDILIRDQEAIAVLNRPGQRPIELSVHTGHMAWPNYVRLDCVASGSEIYLEYREEGFNEADIFAPEYNANFAFYLRPVIDPTRISRPIQYRECWYM